MSTLFADEFLCFDLETTGVDPEGDRIVQAFLGKMDARGQWVPGFTAEWVLNPGIPVPEGAAAVHGFTTERLQQVGQTDIRGALQSMRHIIDAECGTAAEAAGARPVPLVIFNAPFDTTFLNAELRRHGVPELVYGTGRGEIRVFDPLVVDKGIDKYRKGSRKLVDMAPHYGVPLEANAHDAGADCLMTGRVALRLLERPALINRTLDGLQRDQKAWKQEQSTSLQAYFRSPKAGAAQDVNAIVNTGWPIQN